MSLAVDDTIAAIATAPGLGLRGIVRLSGPGTSACLEKSLCLEAGGTLPGTSAPTCSQVLFHCPPPIGDLPCQLYHWPTTSSYTRQVSAEIHLPGAPVLMESVLEHLCRNGARLARPGEFTLRAFLAGRLDLTQAEAVLGVIHASGEEELADALGQLAGGLASPLQQLRTSLLDLLVQLEAGLDFVEEDIRFISQEELGRQVEQAQHAVEEIKEQFTSRRAVESDCRIVIAGAPNAGKSTLFNCLAEDAEAIVSPQPGTTRDYLSCYFKLAETRCLLIDTAGLDSAAELDFIERESQQVSRRQQHGADLVIFCIDGSRAPMPWERTFAEAENRDRLVVVTKADQPVHPQAVLLGTSISCKQETGLEQLQQQMTERIDELVIPGGASRLTQSRCHESIQLAAESLASAQALVLGDQGEELVAVEIRSALDAIGQVTGEIYTDDILDRIFSRFCIGK
ncbi:MAG: tRNA modification GTPase [Planctomycetota bacterium]|nr:tRNA modification GTPase [Planctomycetota bacterium]